MLFSDLVNDGADHTAGAAPRGPEIDEHGLVGLQYVLFERCVSDFCRHE